MKKHRCLLVECSRLTHYAQFSNAAHGNHKRKLISAQALTLL